MTKILLTIPEQSFVLEGENLQAARDAFDPADIDFSDEIVCDTCEEVPVVISRCACNPEKKVESKLYVCPTEKCTYNTYWSFEDMKDKGEPICPYDSEDMVQGCDVCKKREDDDGRCGCTNEDAHGV